MQKHPREDARSDEQGIFINIERRGMQRCNLFSPSPHPQSDHAARDDAQVIREILRAHAWSPLNQHVIRPNDVTSSREANCRHGGVIDHAGKLRFKANAHAGAHRLACAAAELGDGIPRIPQNAGVQRAYRSFHRHRIGNDVRRVSTLNLSKRNNQRIARVGPARNGLIDERDKMGPESNRIHGFMGTRAVPPAAADLDLEILAGRRLRTGGQSQAFPK